MRLRSGSSTPEGRVPEQERVQVICDWGDCHNLSEVRTFLGTVGVMRIFIKNFACRAHYLVKLTRKEVPFQWGEDQHAAQEALKQAIIDSPAICTIDYNSDAAVILSVDTSSIAIGHILSQCDPKNPKVRYYSRFGSIILNEREAQFSQPKLELYGVYRVLKAWKLYLIGVRNLVIEVDA